MLTELRMSGESPTNLWENLSQGSSYPLIPQMLDPYLPSPPLLQLQDWPQKKNWNAIRKTDLALWAGEKLQT